MKLYCCGKYKMSEEALDRVLTAMKEQKPESLPRPFPFLWFVLAMVLILCAVAVARAEEYTNAEIVNAIWVIEGGAKAEYAYGIRSVHYSSVAEARQICFNTVRNNRKRFLKQSEYTDFLEFLQSRYCPTKGKLSKAEQRLNGYWLKNLKYQLAKARR